jgi:hypothetical protein
MPVVKTDLRFQIGTGDHKRDFVDEFHAAAVRWAKNEQDHISPACRSPKPQYLDSPLLEESGIR